MAIDDSALLAHLNDPAYEYKQAPVEPDGYKKTKEILQLLGGIPEVANPTPAPNVPTVMDTAAFISEFTSVQVQLIDGSIWNQMIAYVAANDRVGLAQSLATLLQAQWIDAAKKDQLTTDYIDATEPDPNWPATIPDPAGARVYQLFGQGEHSSRDQIRSILGRTQETN